MNASLFDAEHSILSLLNVQFDTFFSYNNNDITQKFILN